MNAPHPGEALLTAACWQGRLNETMSVEDVVALGREYLAHWSPADLSLLPPECRPGRIVDANDMNDYAVTLMQRSCGRDRISDPVLHRLATFFTRASLRVAQIRAQRGVEISIELR